MGDNVFCLVPGPYYEAEEDIYIQQITKMVVNSAGFPTDWDAEVGLPTEIVPLDKPYALWDRQRLPRRRQKQRQTGSLCRARGRIHEPYASHEQKRLRQGSSRQSTPGCLRNHRHQSQRQRRVFLRYSARQAGGVSAPLVPDQTRNSKARNCPRMPLSGCRPAT